MISKIIAHARLWWYKSHFKDVWFLPRSSVVKFECVDADCVDAELDALLLGTTLWSLSEAPVSEKMSRWEAVVKLSVGAEERFVSKNQLRQI